MDLSLCQSCSKIDTSASAVVICLDCKEGLCKPCLNAHKENPECIIHRISEVNSNQRCMFAAPSINTSKDDVLPTLSILKFKFEREINILYDGKVYISSLAVTKDNRVILCNARSKNLLVYSENGKHIQDCKLHGEPWDMAFIHGGSKAVVTLENMSAIQFIETSPTVNPGKSLSLPHKCYGVAVIHNHVYLGGRGSIYVIDNAGKPVTSFDVGVNGFVWFLHPGPSETLLFTSYDFDDVGSLNLKTGKYYFRCEKKTIKGPEGITTDKNANIYIACRDSENIQRLTPTGVCQSIVLSSKDKIKRPYGLAFNSQCTKLYVANNDGQSITIYLGF